MGCLHSNLKVSEHKDRLPNDSSSCEERRPSHLVGDNCVPEVPWPANSALQLHGIKLHGTATAGDAASAALLCSRLVVARGHILAAVFEGHVSPAAAEYCRMYCWEAFVQAAASWQQVPAAATLRTLDRGFLTSSQHSLDTRLATGCSATLVHIDLAAHTVTTAIVGSHGTVALGCVDLTSPAAAAAARADEANGRGARGAPSGQQQQQQAGARGERQQQQAGRPRAALLLGAADGGAGGRAINHVVTLEAARGEERRGLSGLVDVAASTLAVGDASAVPSGSGGLTRGVAVPRASPALSTTFRDAAQESTLLDAGRPSPGDNSTTTITAPAVTPPPTFHAHAVASAAGTRFAALSRLHCGCDVRVSSRQLVPGDECILLMAGSGGTGPPRNGGGGGSNIIGGGGSVDVGTGAVGSGPRTFIGSGSRSQVLGVSLAAMADVCCGPAGALSAGDAVTLAHEMASRAVGAMPLTRSDPGSKSSRFEVLYDSYDAEAAAMREAQAAGSGAAAAASTAGGSAGPGVSVAAAACSAAAAGADCGALAVASYATAAAVARSQAAEVAARGMGAACLVMWLDWGPASGPTGAPTRPRHSPTLHDVELSPALRRWQLLRAYCRFRAVRRRRLLIAWQQLVATALAPPPLGSQGHPQVPSWLPVQLGTAAAAALPASIESVGSSLPPAVAMANRTASFTSRAPVMMEFVEELPSPDNSATAVVCSLAMGPAASATGPELLMVAGGGTTTLGPAAAAGTVSGNPAPLPSAAAAMLDALLSASASSPYGISGLVVAPMSSTDDDSEVEYEEDEQARTRAALMAAAATARPPRNFVLRPGPSHRRLNELMGIGSLRTSHSSPDLKDMEGHGPAAAATAAEAASASTHGRPVNRMAAEVLMPSTPHLDAVAAAVGCGSSASSSSQYVTARGTAGGNTSDALSAGGIGGGGGSGGSGAIDWSLIMTSLPHSNLPRGSNSAGHTPIPSATASRFPHGALPDDSGLGSPQGSSVATGGGSGSGPMSSGQGAAPSGELATVSASGGYLPIPGGSVGGRAVRRQKPVPHTAAYPTSPLSAAGYGQRSDSRTSASPTWGGGTVGGSSGELMTSGRSAPAGGIASTRFVTATASPGPASAPPCDGSPEQDGDYETASEDLPQLCIESTAELAALMAEIIITEDGQVVRMGGPGGGGGGGMPPPYTGRNHGLQLGHKSSRSLSRQGSRGWTPRLAIVREDAREATTSTSASQLLPAEVARFSAISEERTSQGSSSGTTERAQSLCSGSEHHSSAANSGQSRANPVASNGSPASSMEDPTTAFGTMAPTPLVPSAAPSSTIASAAVSALAAGPIAAAALASCSQSALPTSQAATHSLVSPWLSPFAKPPMYEPELYHSPTRGTHSTAAATPDAAPHAASTSNVTAPAYGPGPHYAQAHTLAASGPSSRAPLVPPYGENFPDAAADNAAADSLANVLRKLAPSPSRERHAGSPDLQHSGSGMVISNVPGQVRPPPRLAIATGIAHEGVFSEAASGGTAAAACASAASSVSLADGLPVAPATTPTTRGSEKGPFATEPTGRATSSRHRKLGRTRSRSSTQLSSLAASRGETAGPLAGEDVEYEDGSSRTAGTVYRDAAGDAALQRVGVGLVGRSHSMLVGRAAQAHQSLPHLQQQYASGAHPQDPHQYHTGAGSGQAPSQHAQPDGSARQSQPYHGAATTTGANTHNTRHLYGLSDMPSQQQQGASPVPSARGGLPSTAANAATGGGEMLSLGTFQTGTFDRSWSVGSTSGPLGSLLHSTTSKSSFTGLMSTAVPTPVCNSAAGSGSRLPIFNTTPAISATNAVPPAAGAASAVVDASDAPCFRSTHPSLSNSRQDSGIAAGARLAAAKPLHLAPVEGTSAATVHPPAAWPPRTPSPGPAGAATSPAEPYWLPPYPLATTSAGATNPGQPESSHPAERQLSTPPPSPHAPTGTFTLAPATVGQTVDLSISCSSSVAVAPSRDPLTLPASYGMPGGGSVAAAPLADAALACSDDGGGFPHVSRSDASCTVGWNSASAWIASTTASTAGRTGDMAGLTGGRGMGMGGSSFTGASAVLGGGMGIGIGIGVGGVDTSGLIACNPAYSSVSGLLVTADMGPQSSNTQLLLQMGLSTQQPVPSLPTIMAQTMGASASSNGAAAPLQLTPLPPPPQHYPQHLHSSLMHPGFFRDSSASSFALCSAGPASGAGHSASSNAAHLGQLLVGSSLRAGTSPRQAGGPDPCLGQLLGGLGVLQEDAAGQDDETGE